MQDKDSAVMVAAAIKEEQRNVKAIIDRSQAHDAAKAVGTSMVLARSIDDALVILHDGIKVGTRPYLRTAIEQSVKALMAQDRTYAQRIRRSAQMNGTEKELMPLQPAVSPEIVCLVGSTRFKSSFESVNESLTHEGKIVLSVGSFPHASHRKAKEELYGEEVAAALEDLHLRKIDISDSIYVINPKATHNAKHGYIGKSAAKEIVYAQASHKRIYSLEPLPSWEDLIEKAGLTLVSKSEATDA